MIRSAAIEIPSIHLDRCTNPQPTGIEALTTLLGQAAAYIDNLRNRLPEDGNALLGRVRGTGPGVSFGAYVDALQREFAVEMQSPFEGSDNVAGGVLLPQDAGIAYRDDGFLFLRFDANARDLPLHTHDHSERLIYVIEGRGFFHVRDSDSEGTTRHVPVRSRDVLMFRRGTLHTFSTQAEPLHLLSFHAPFIALNDPRQYSLPDEVVYPAETVCEQDSRVSCDAVWARLS